MTRKTLILTRAASVADRKLSHGAARLFALLVEAHYLSVESEGHEFDLTAAWIQKRLPCGHNQARRFIAELVDRFYIRARGIRGCPPTPVFSFFQVTRNGDDESPETGTITSPKQGRQVTRNGDAVLRERSTESKRGGGAPSVAPSKKPPAGPWWTSPPQFEKLDLKTFPRERKALAKDMLDFVQGKMEALKTEFRLETSYKDWPDQARATYEAFRARRDDIKAWTNGVRR